MTAVSNTPLEKPLLVLASSSPYRCELLKRLKFDFKTISPEIDETPLTDESPENTALRLALQKAQAVSTMFSDGLIIGSDQVALLNNHQILGKPGTHLQAVKQLQACRGQEVIFHTALCLFNTRTQSHQLRNVPTRIRFRDVSDDEIERYLQIDQPYNCAGSAKIESLGITLIAEQSSSDPTAIIGLPLIALTDMLRAENFPLYGS